VGRAGRFAIGFVLVPPTPIFLYQLHGQLTGQIFYPAMMGPVMWVLVVMWFLLLAAVQSYPYAILFGLPSLFLMERRGWTSLGAYMALGPAVVWGMAGIQYLLSPLVWLPIPWPSDVIIESLAESGLVGSMCSVLLWLIARPDRRDSFGPIFSLYPAYKQEAAPQDPHSEGASPLAGPATESSSTDRSSKP
jgi:hypothetical protein